MATKVLLVDDSPDILEMMATVIRMQSDYEVREAPSSRAALAILREWRPDVLITDLMMPDMNGLDLITQIYRELPPPLPPIIAVSGFSDLGPEAIERGASTFQLKPIDPTEIVGLIETLVHGTPRGEPRAGAYERRKAASRRAELLLEAAMAQRPNFEMSLRRTIRILSRYFDGASALIVMLEHAEPTILASSNSERFHEGHASDSLLGLAADVIESGSALIVPDLRDIPAFSHRGPDSKLRFMVAAPIRLPDRVAVGCLMLLDERPRAFDANDLAILQHAARAGTDVLRGIPPPVFLRDSGFLIEPIWNRWLGEELAHTNEGRTLQLAMIATERSGWGPDSAHDLVAKLPPRTAIAEVEPATLLFYEVRTGSASSLDRFLAEVEARMGIAYASSMNVSELDLSEKTDAVLAVLESVHAASRARGRGSLAASALLRG